MPLPPRGDPRRPLYLAIASCRALGALFVLFSMCGLLPLLVMRRGPLGGAVPWIAMGSIIYVIPGVGYILCAIYLKQRQLWAVITALVLTCFIGLFLVIGTIFLMVLTVTKELPAPVWIAIGFQALIAVALGQLIYHLAKGFEAIKYPPIGEEYGFEPIFPAHPAPLACSNPHDPPPT